MSTVEEVISRMPPARRTRAIIVALLMFGAVLAGCSGEESEVGESTTTAQATSTTVPPDTSTSTTTTTTTPATTTTTTTTLPPLLEPASVAEYLLIVLRASRDSGVNEQTAALLAQPSVEGNEALLAALRTNLAQLERVVPPAEAVEYHSRIVEQAASTVALYEALVEAVASGDTAAIEELAGESLGGVGEFAQVGELQLELLEVALEGRTDPLASYVLDVSRLGIRLSSDVEGFIERLDEVLSGEQDLELLASVADEEAVLLQGLAAEFGKLHPPQVAASYHASQMQAAGGVGGALARMATAIRDDDAQSAQRAFESMFGFMGAASEALVAQQDMLIAALEGPGPDSGSITWARVQLGSGQTFGFSSDVVAFEDGLLAFGSERFESDDGVAWFALGHEFTSLDSISDAVVVGAEIVGVGSRSGSSSRDAAVWTSGDGRVWIPVSVDMLATERQQGMTGLAVGDSGYVAVGRQTDGEGFPAAVAVWHARRIDEWTQLDFPDEGDQVAVSGVASDGDGYVMVGTGLWTSQDGITWTATDVGDARLAKVRHTMVGYIAVGQDAGMNGIALRSTGAEEWSRSVLPGADGPVFVEELVEADGRLLAFGWVEQTDERVELAVWESDDGVSWSRSDLTPPLTSGFGSRLAGTAGGPGVVVVGTGVDGPFALLGFIP